MCAPPRLRFRVELGLAGLSSTLALVTLLWRDWIEAVFGVDPDRHGGSLEWAVVAGLCGLALVSGALARGERRGRAQPQS